MGKSAGKSAIPASPIFVGKDERVVYVSRWAIGGPDGSI